MPEMTFKFRMVYYHSTQQHAVASIKKLPFLHVFRCRCRHHQLHFHGWTIFVCSFFSFYFCFLLFTLVFGWISFNNFLSYSLFPPHTFARIYCFFFDFLYTHFICCYVLRFCFSIIIITNIISDFFSFVVRNIYLV